MRIAKGKIELSKIKTMHQQPSLIVILNNRAIKTYHNIAARYDFYACIFKWDLICSNVYQGCTLVQGFSPHSTRLRWELRDIIEIYLRIPC